MRGSVEPSSGGGATGTGSGGSVVVGATVVVVVDVVVGATVVVVVDVVVVVEVAAMATGGAVGSAARNSWVSSAPPQPASRLRARASHRRMAESLPVRHPFREAATTRAVASASATHAGTPIPR
jgi:hypothetical protein